MLTDWFKNNSQQIIIFDSIVNNIITGTSAHFINNLNFFLDNYIFINLSTKSRCNFVLKNLLFLSR